MTPREAAHAIWQAALAATDVTPLVHRALRQTGEALNAGSITIGLTPIRDVLVLGCGKAGASMARAAEGILGDRIADGLVVVKDGYVAPTRIVRLVEAGHPVPDARSHTAGLALLELARSAEADDLVLVLISGGGSALASVPAPPITLDEKQEVTRLLMTAGATINELNAVRKHLSVFKGGQLARAAAPARVLTLVLSDVIGDPLDVIASGPTAPDPTTFDDALRVLERYRLDDRVSASVRRRLGDGARGKIEETPKPGDPLFTGVTNLVIGNNALITDAALAKARGLGYRPHLVTRELQGEAREVARALVERARALEAPACLIAAGETTVTVKGRGRGGRCQEFALAAALELRAGDRLTILAAGTDGTDGPTDAAGALVDSDTVRRGLRLGVNPRSALDDNDAYGFLRASGDLIVSGPTNTNLLDLYLLLRPDCSSDGRSALSE